MNNPTDPVLKPSNEAMTLDEQIRALVIARIRTLPEDISLSLGGEAELKREELIAHVEKDDAVGKEFTDMQLEFLRDMASGALYETH